MENKELVGIFNKRNVASENQQFSFEISYEYNLKEKQSSRKYCVREIDGNIHKNKKKNGRIEMKKFRSADHIIKCIELM